MLLLMSRSCISQYVSCYHTWVTKTSSIAQNFSPFFVLCCIILLSQQGFSYISSNGCQRAGLRLGMGTVFAGVRVSVIERGQS